MTHHPIKLTQYSHGAGCGCKISPKILSQILAGTFIEQKAFPDLIIGNQTNDDAAVLDIGNQQVLISTTDFFMPIVDDPFTFGQIAATNAISDIYAMGGRPCLAIALLGWPINKIDPVIAGDVIRGGRSICDQANIPLAGGHSIDSPEPIFGLAVNGLAEKSSILANSNAQDGDLLFLTKPLGIGILTTAKKKNILQDSDEALAVKSMTTLNKLGEKLGSLKGVHACTDVTGFGLLGHTLEMCKGSSLQAVLNAVNIPTFPNIGHYIEQNCIPGGTNRNLESYGHQIKNLSDQQSKILADPQTSGGLLIAVDPEQKQRFIDYAATYLAAEFPLTPIGFFRAGSGVIIQ